LLLLHALDVVFAVFFTQIHDLFGRERFAALKCRVHLFDTLLNRLLFELIAHFLDPALILLLRFTRFQRETFIHVFEGHVVV
jgi:hypothetical protein